MMMKTTGVLRWMNTFWCLNDDDMDVEEDEEGVERVYRQLVSVKI